MQIRFSSCLYCCSAANMTTTHTIPASSIKTYNTEPADMTKKGRFKVRKVKSTTDDPNKNILKENSNKSKTGSNISLSPKQQQQLKHQQLGALGTGKISIYNVSKLFPYSIELGGQYVLLCDPQKTCEEVLKASLFHMNEKLMRALKTDTFLF